MKKLITTFLVLVIAQQANAIIITLPSPNPPTATIVPPNAVVMDFDGLSVGAENLEITEAYHEDGFILDIYGLTVQVPRFYMYGTDSVSAYTGQKSLIQAQSGQGVGAILTRDGGTPFDLFSIDLIEIVNGPSFLSPNLTEVLFEGIKSDSTVVTQLFVLDGIWGFETFDFNGFTNLTSLKWDIADGFSSYHQFDNIVLAPATVPAPATILLFALGLIELISIVKRKKS